MLSFLSQLAAAQGLNNPPYRIIGRADYGDAAGPRFAWPGTSVHVRFTGRKIQLRMRDRGNYFNLTLDVTPLPVLIGNLRTESYRIADHLRDGAHELILTKRTEASIGETQILGFDLEPGKNFLPPSPLSSRRIEIIGDSISCGFGIEGRSSSCPFTPHKENHALTYGALTASELGAELTTIAWSGKGMYRNYGEDRVDPLPALYPRILPERPNSIWNFQSVPPPQVVIIHLGTNDYSSGDPGSRFNTAYLRFIEQIRRNYPNTWIMGVLSPMLVGPLRTRAAQAIQGVIQQVKRQGDPRVTYFEFAAQSATHGYGCAWHPSITTHRIMSARLTTELRRLLSW